MSRKTLIWTSIPLLILLVMGGGTYYALAVQADEDGLTPVSGETGIQTAVAHQGDLMVFASGTGKLTSLNQTTLAFEDGGTLVELLVSVGDEVSAGDILARVQVEKSASQVDANIAEAELAVIADQQALDDLYAEAEMAAAQALFDLEAAQAELAALQDNELEAAQALQAVAAAEETLEKAEMAVYIANAHLSEDEIYTAYASLLFKEKALTELQEQLAKLDYEYRRAKDKDLRDRIKSQIEQVTAQMYNQQVVVEEARYRYETIDEPADPIDLKLAQAQMETAQAQLDQAKLALSEAQHGAPPGDLALAKAELANAQVEWERWQDGPDPDDVMLAETRLEASQLNLSLARQENLIADLIAPMDGTVMEIHAAVNQTIDGDQIITLADISQPRMEVYLEETDYQSAQAGNRIEVVFDALPDMTFTGSLLAVYPSLTQASNSQVVGGLAILDDIELALPIGLNASVDVIAGEAHDAVLVPIEALHENGSGETFVNVQVDGGFEQREVTVGLMDFTSAAIISGLESGEVVALGDQED